MTFPLSLAQKIVIVQWVLGFMGAWLVFSTVSSVKDSINGASEADVRIVETTPMIKAPYPLKTLQSPN